MKVLVTGSAGQLAYAIRKTWRLHELFFPEESELDLTKPDSIKNAIQAYRPEVVINAGAFTQVDQCEREADRAMLVNGQAVGWLASECDRTGALLVQISTDYVFDGHQAVPFREEDPPRPGTVYGKSKLLGETNAQAAKKHLVVRTAWLYDAWGRNFYRTMLGAAQQGRALKVVNDQIGSPTTCRALARQLQVAVDEGWLGLVHVTCTGQASWFEFAREIFRLNGTQADLSPCATSEYPVLAARPSFSVLDGSRRALLGTDVMPDWHEALQEVISDPN